MTDYNKLEKEISREELILKLKIETGLRECYESESAKLKDEIAECKSRFNTMCDKYRELEKVNKMLNDEIEALKDALHDDEVEIHKLKEERDDYSADIDSYEDTVAELRIKVHDLERDKEMSDRNVEDLLAKLNSYDEHYNELKSELKSANKRVEAYKNDYYRVLNANEFQADRIIELQNREPQIHIDNMYIAYYANEPDEEETADIIAAFKHDEED